MTAHVVNTLCRCGWGVKCNDNTLSIVCADVAGGVKCNDNTCCQ